MLTINERAAHRADTRAPCRKSVAPRDEREVASPIGEAATPVPPSISTIRRISVCNKANLMKSELRTNRFGEVLERVDPGSRFQKFGQLREGPVWLGVGARRLKEKAFRTGDYGG